MNTKETIVDLLEDTQRPGIDKVIAFMESGDFFTAPASTKYHGAYAGGLADHSLNVYKVLNAKNKAMELRIPDGTVIITALLHDLCKMNTYAIEKAWRKDQFNKWEQYDRYVHKEEFPIGHGDKSVILLQPLIHLTPLEIVMIRWHMGGYDAKETYKLSGEAWKMFKGAVALHTADLEATYILENKEEGK